MNDRTKLELSFVAEMFGFVFVVLGALIAERIAARGIIAIVGAAAIWLARNWRDPHYWTVKLPVWPAPAVKSASSNVVHVSSLDGTFTEFEAEVVSHTVAQASEKPTYNRAPWMESSKPDASKGTLK